MNAPTSHRVATTLDIATWAALDRYREREGHATLAESLRALCERVVAEELDEIGGMRQLGTIVAMDEPGRIR